MTPKQQAFVREYILSGNASQAAIKAGYSEQTAGNIGFENLRKPEIAEAIRKAHDKAAENAGMTIEKHLADLLYLRDAASGAEKYAAAVTAEMARGKVAGFYVEKLDANMNVRGSVAYKANIPRR